MRSSEIHFRSLNDHETKRYRLGPGDRSRPAGFAAANDLVGKSDVDVREAIGDKFPKHIYHSIVCIGALVAHWERITGPWTPSARRMSARGPRSS